MRVVDGHQSREVTLNDGIWAVRMGNAAQVSAETGKVVNFYGYQFGIIHSNSKLNN